MSKKVTGSLNGISRVDLRELERFYNEKLDLNQIVSFELAKNLYNISQKIGKIVGLLISREGAVEKVFVGDKNILYLPDLGRIRLSKGRLRHLRLVCTVLKNEFELTQDYYTDLQKLRLDMIIGVKEIGHFISMKYSYLTPIRDSSQEFSKTEYVEDLENFYFDFNNFISNLELELENSGYGKQETEKECAILVGVYQKDYKREKESIEELVELVKTAGVEIADIITQKRDIDPKTILGKGKLEEIVLKCLSFGADIIIFDGELKPSQLREITNISNLKILDRSMVILDIFAKRANSSEGRLQVELAQLKYNLPRILEKNAGLSRLGGGIGTRGPGETKLEIGKRRMNDRIRFLENKIDKLSNQRELKQERRKNANVPLVSILGYTNAGKSTLFNVLTKGDVFVEDKLFATLDTTQKQLCIVGHKNKEKFVYCNLVLSDTVGFIQDLPKELTTAFKATLDELYGAELLLHVLDVSDKNALFQYKAVVDILVEMKLGDIPRIVVFNKCDKVDEEFDLETLEDSIANHVKVSAKTKKGIQNLKSKILDYFHKGYEVFS